jgi:uncharacterized membrane protein
MKHESAANGRLKSWASGAALGMFAMYLFDPDRGRRRRALTRDKIQSLVVRTSDAIDVTVRDFSNRLKGMQARASSPLWRRNKQPDDQILQARVRAQLGRVVSHPHAIEVLTQHGRITLRGPILASEKEQLLDAVGNTPGVASVEDLLEVHQSAEGVSSLQGGRKRVQVRSEFMQDNWTPAVRAIATLGGGTLGLYGLSRHTPLGTALAVVGLGFLARGVTNMPLKSLVGIRTDQPMIHLDKTIEINAPAEAIFDMWTKYENFPHFMSHVQEVQDLGEGRSHWVVKGPAGARIEWNARLTEWNRPDVVAWESEPGAAVQHAGRVRFEPTNGRTRISLRMTYSPPAGALGHSLALLLGADPKHQLDEDLMRMKEFIETGIPPHDAAQPVAPSPVLH